MIQESFRSVSKKNISKIYNEIHFKLLHAMVFGFRQKFRNWVFIEFLKILWNYSPTLRLFRSETRLTVYRALYIYSFRNSGQLQVYICMLVIYSCTTQYFILKFDLSEVSSCSNSQKDFMKDLCFWLVWNFETFWNFLKRIYYCWEIDSDQNLRLHSEKSYFLI